ncbi:MAG TPA: CDP-diacylglycerol--glycerol-3-phosphate 3-phosphatidyltransferase [Actinomycetales bacterium]|nr:CDP-diacylglycerol--glycerol-3-phosphate 3-phosphatidyltransferase [Actinomycetales bacterium]
MVEKTSSAGAREIPLLNIANVLTLARVALVPVFAVALFMDSGQSTAWRLVAAGAFAIAAVTDRFDGQIARNRGLVTDFGKIVDPIADKALIGTALIGLSLLAFLPWWVTVVILVRELGITALRLIIVRRGVIPASRGGKLKTVVQIFAIGLYILPLVQVASWLISLAHITMGAALILTVGTGVHYIYRAAVLVRSKHE